MMKMKLNKKIAGASAMLLLSATMLGTSTFAWFTMNKKVTVTGMEMKTKVGANLLISADNQESTYTTKNLSQAREALLEPVSTVSGKTDSFYYTVNAKANGDAVEDVYTKYNEAGGGSNDTCAKAGKTTFDTAFNAKYLGSGAASGDPYGTAYGYVDYVFYLKATSDAASQKIVMTECNLLVGNTPAAITPTGSGTDKDNAWRVAVFATDVTYSGGTGDLTSVDPAKVDGESAKVILTRSGADNHETNKAVSAPNAAPTAMEVNYNTWNANYLADMGTTVGTTKYLKVTVRVWLEGEDVSCKSSTYAQLTDKYQLAAKFELLNNDEVAGKAVQNIQSDTSKVKASDFPSGS